VANVFSIHEAIIGLLIMGVFVCQAVTELARYRQWVRSTLGGVFGSLFRSLLVSRVNPETLLLVLP